MPWPFKTIGIAGGGRMGESIFYHLADHDYSLVWLFRREDMRERALEKFGKKLQRLRKAGAIDEKTFHARNTQTVLTTFPEDLADCDLVIETISEDAQLKSALFRRLDGIVNRDCIFVSNSSSIRPSLICPDSERRERFGGLHFFFPVQFNSIVELTAAATCSPMTVAALVDFSSSIGKQPLVLPESGAFLLNKAFIYVQAQAFRFYRENVLSIREIDDLVKNHLFAMGIFEFLDHVGLDVILSAAKYYFEDMEHKEFIRVVVEETEKLVAEGYLGVKSGRGFYCYNKDGSEDGLVELRPLSAGERRRYEEDVVDKLACLYVNSVCHFVDMGLCTCAEIDAALTEYKGMEKSPQAVIDALGAERICELLRCYYRETGEKVYLLSPSLVKMADEDRGGAAGE